MSRMRFPEGFLWGVSTSSYQIEGGNVAADWYEWESAGRAAETAGSACASWERYRDDVGSAVSLGVGVYRISLEWSRIEPEPGIFDDDAVRHYTEWLAYARRSGLKTMLVLWHFTNPIWFSRGGGWTRREGAGRFERYVRRVVPHLAAHVDYWATLNEANTYVSQGWISGQWPPGRRKDYRNGFAAYAGLAEGHRRAWLAVKELAGESALVGLTHAMPWLHPAPGYGVLAAGCCAYWRWLGVTNFLDRLGSTLDWLGVQYYHDAPCRVLRYDLDAGECPRTDMGWRICPEGIHHVVRDAWRRYRVPVFVTENGIADAADAQRGRFLLDHLAWLLKAIDEGVDVRGYLHWSLIDNFEWAHGFEPRFGLVEVDRETLERRPRPSARLFSRIVRENALPADLCPELTYSNGWAALAP